MTPNQVEAVGNTVAELLTEGDREGLVVWREAVTVTYGHTGAIVRTYWSDPDEPDHVSVTLAARVGRTGHVTHLAATFGGAAA